jgi:hypothetical protein
LIDLGKILKLYPVLYPVLKRSAYRLAQLPLRRLVLPVIILHPFDAAFGGPLGPRGGRRAATA